MELAPPTIDDAFARCVRRGARHIVVAPYFFFAGRHVSEDVPGLAAAAAARHGACLIAAPAAAAGGGDGKGSGGDGGGGGGGVERRSGDVLTYSVAPPLGLDPVLADVVHARVLRSLEEVGK